MAQHTINLACIGDAYGDRDNPTVNYGSNTLLKICGNFLNNSYRYIAYLKFEQSNLQYKKIISLTCRIYVVTGYVYSGYQSAIYTEKRISQSLDEGTITFQTEGGQNGGTSSYSNITIPQNSWITLNINSAVYNDTLTNGLKISGNLGYTTNYIDFHSRENTNKPYMVVVYEDAPPLQPIANNPNGEYINSSQIIRLEWEYRTEVADTQAKYKVEWRKKGTETWTVIEETTSNNYCDVPANTFTSSNVEWRVTTYNQYNEASPVSDTLTFFAIGQPSIPTISVISSAKPFVSWNSEQQQLWQLQVVQGESIIIDTGNMPGINIYSYQVNNFINDGNYTAKVRVRNEYNFWSEWGTSDFVISTTKPDAPIITLLGILEHGISMSLSYTSPECLVYRSEFDKDDYILISETTETTYIDYTVQSDMRYKYFVRAVNVDNAFCDSTTINGKITLTSSILADVNNLSNILALMKRTEKGLGRSIVYSRDRQFVNFVGREYPVVETNSYKNKVFNLAYFVDTNQLEKLLDLVNAGIVLYRDEKGEKMYCSITNFNYIPTIRGYSVSLSLTKVDYFEGS